MVAEITMMFANVLYDSLLVIVSAMVFILGMHTKVWLLCSAQTQWGSFQHSPRSGAFAALSWWLSGFTVKVHPGFGWKGRYGTGVGERKGATKGWEKEEKEKERGMETITPSTCWLSQTLPLCVSCWLLMLSKSAILALISMIVCQCSV